MRNQVKRLIKYTSNPQYPNEQGEPFTTCLALRNLLISVLKGEIQMDIHQLLRVMTKLKNEWDNVVIARKRAMGQTITDSWLRTSQSMDDFVSYLDFLKEMGIPQTELDKIFVETTNYALSGENNNG